MLLDLATNEKYLRSFLADPNGQVPYAANVIDSVRSIVAPRIRKAPTSAQFRRMANVFLADNEPPLPPLSSDDIAEGVAWLRKQGVLHADA